MSQTQRSHFDVLCLTASLFACWLLTPSFSHATPPPARSLPALSPAIHKLLHGFQSDKPIMRKRHYVQTNERRHDHFKPFIEGLGGGYIGIASDQNYTLMAYARSEFAWLIDYDAGIQSLHWVHRALILASETADRFLQRWSPRQRKQTFALLQKAYQQHPRRKSLLWIYRRSQARLYPYLRGRRYVPAKTRPTWLNTPRYYRYIRQLYQRDRIRILHGNLIGARTLVGIGVAARKARMPIRVFYTSNAEEWIRFRAPYRRNINALYVDAKSVMLRTLWLKLFQPRSTDLWQYNVQKLQHLQAFLRRGDSKISALNREMRLSHLWGLTLLGFPRGYVPSPATR